MSNNDFEIKFQKLQRILETDKEKCDEFLEKPTVKDSYEFACKGGGNLDEKMYYSRVKEVISSPDDENFSCNDFLDDVCNK